MRRNLTLEFKFALSGLKIMLTCFQIVKTEKMLLKMILFLIRMN